MTLCRRWWNSWWTFFHLSISALPSRSSKCPRSCVHPALLAQSPVRRRRWNSWWKCRRPCPILRYCSGPRSSTLTFQFLLVVEGETQIFKGFLRGQSSTAPQFSSERFSERIVEQNVHILAAGGGLRDFRPGQSSSSVARSPADWLNPEDEAFQWFFRTFPQDKKARHNLRTQGRNCLRTRAHGRRQLMTRPWCLMRRRRRSLRRSLKWSTWSLMFICGGASGSLLASNIAGGWPLPMDPRLAIPYCGRRGSSAEGQGDVLGTTVDTWSTPVPGACAVFFFFSTRR